MPTYRDVKLFVAIAAYFTFAISALLDNMPLVKIGLTNWLMTGRL